MADFKEAARRVGLANTHLARAVFLLSKDTKEDWSALTNQVVIALNTLEAALRYELSNGESSRNPSPKKRKK